MNRKTRKTRLNDLMSDANAPGAVAFQITRCAAMDKSRAEIAHVLPDDVRRFLALSPKLLPRRTVLQARAKIPPCDDRFGYDLGRAGFRQENPHGADVQNVALHIDTRHDI